MLISSIIIIIDIFLERYSSYEMNSLRFTHSVIHTSDDDDDDVHLLAQSLSVACSVRSIGQWL